MCMRTIIPPFWEFHVPWQCTNMQTRKFEQLCAAGALLNSIKIALTSMWYVWPTCGESSNNICFHKILSCSVNLEASWQGFRDLPKNWATSWPIHGPIDQCMVAKTSAGLRQLHSAETSWPNNICFYRKTYLVVQACGGNRTRFLWPPKSKQQTKQWFLNQLNGGKIKVKVGAVVLP